MRKVKSDIDDPCVYIHEKYIIIKGSQNERKISYKICEWISLE